jgi:hypothetical protein
MLTPRGLICAIGGGFDGSATNLSPPGWETPGAGTERKLES